MAPFEEETLKWIASGAEVDPKRIKPRLRIVKPDTLESKLFRYACLHWSIPVSDGYGRRLRFLIFDESNDKLMGSLGLGTLCIQSVHVTSGLAGILNVKLRSYIM